MAPKRKQFNKNLSKSLDRAKDLQMQLKHVVDAAQQGLAALRSLVEQVEKRIAAATPASAKSAVKTRTVRRSKATGAKRGTSKRSSSKRSAPKSASTKRSTAKRSTSKSSGTRRRASVRTVPGSNVD